MQNEYPVVEINPYPYTYNGWARGKYCKRHVGPHKLYCHDHIGQAPWNDSKALSVPVTEDDCYSCDTNTPYGECEVSERLCGHHCNCSWVHDNCHWCGIEFGEEE